MPEAKDFPPLSVTGIGYVDGLLGANCRHSIGPGDGVFNPWKDYDSEENRAREALEQRQRLLERRIRNTRREAIGAKAALDAARDDPEAYAALQRLYQRKALRLKKQDAAYEAFCKENGLRRKDDRLSPAGWDRAQASAINAATRNAERTQRERLEAEAAIRKDIKSGKYPLAINPEKQARHMQGTAIPGRSVITVPMEELQRLVEEKAGTGRLEMKNGGMEWTHKEIVDMGQEIGYVVTENGGGIKTQYVKIHYSKTGVHVVPHERRYKNAD